MEKWLGNLQSVAYPHITEKDLASLLETQGLLSPLLYFETVTARGLRTRILTGLVVLVGSAMRCIRRLCRLALK